MSNVLVVGGAGYIGSHMVRVLLQNAKRVIVFDNLSTGHRRLVSKDALFIKGDLRNPKEIAQVFKKHKIDAVMHFAASSLVGESMENPLKYYDNNVTACVNLLKVMVEAKVRYFIFSSTCAVYGQPEKLPIDESTPNRPANTYGQTKLMVERILEDISRKHDFYYIALRYFNACGAHAAAETGEWHEIETHLIPNMFKVLTGEKKEFVIFGSDYPTPDGTCVRDYIHIEDLCRAHLLALEYLKKNKKSDFFNLGNGEGYSVKEIIKAVEKNTGKKVSYKIGPRRPGDPPRLIARAEKAKKVLGWEPKINLDRIIKSAWDWELKSQSFRGKSK